MTLYARIEEGVVAELLETSADIVTLFPPALVWAPAPAGVQQGWSFDGNIFSAPVAQPFRPTDGAMAELTARIDRLLDVISGMQSDYITAGDMANASLCRDAKNSLKAAKTDPVILATTSRAAFNAAVLARWKAIAALAPLDVRAEFARYATAA